MEGASARIRIELSPDLSRIIVAALTPEAEAPSSSRSTVHLQQHDGGLSLHLEASDTAALRAAINSYLHWIGGIIEIVEGLRGDSKGKGV